MTRNMGEWVMADNTIHAGAGVDVTKELAERAKKLHEKTQTEHGQIFICIAGGPGSGKSTLAEAVSDEINEAEGKCVSVVLPMDGYHKTRAEMKEMAKQNKIIGDPKSTTGETTSFEDLLARRGSPWTFDPESCYRDFSDARKFGKGSFPVYSREKSDPVPDGVMLKREHKYVFCEGNYLLAFDDADWKPLSSVWDQTWFISVPQDVVLERLIKRHLETWTDEKTRIWGAEGEAGAKRKAEANDLKNSVWIESVSKKYADLLVMY